MNLNIEDKLVNGTIGLLKQTQDLISVKRPWLLFPSDIRSNRRQEMRHNSEVEWTAIDKSCKKKKTIKKSTFNAKKTVSLSSCRSS